MLDTEPDPVLRVLIGLNLPDQEANFRGMLDIIDAPQDTLEVRHLAIATVGTLMMCASVPWQVILRTVKSLDICSNERLFSESCGIAIINGGTLLVPTEDSVEFYELPGLRRIEEPPAAYVTQLYTVPTIWSRVEQILAEG